MKYLILMSTICDPATGFVTHFKCDYKGSRFLLTPFEYLRLVLKGKDDAE